MKKVKNNVLGIDSDSDRPDPGRQALYVYPPPLIRVRQNDAEPSRSESGSTTMVPVLTVSYSFTLILFYLIFNFYFRKLTNEEEVCADICVSKHIAYNNKVNQRDSFSNIPEGAPPKKNTKKTKK
jgi:hypothetical protein